jgi:hypothetical protein
MPQIQAEEVIHDLYDPRTGRVQWADFVTPSQTPPGKVFIMRKNEWSTQQVFSSGMTHLSKYEIIHLSPTEEAQFYTPSGKGYNDVPTTPEVLNLPRLGPDVWLPNSTSWPNMLNGAYFQNGQPLTEQQGADKGNIADLRYPINVLETKENWHAVSSHWPFWKPYFQNWSRRLSERFGADNYMLSYNYLDGFIHNIAWLGRAEAKALLRQPLSQWPGNQMLPGGTLEHTNTGCYPIYLGAIDLVRNETFNLAYSCMVAQKAGKKQVAFMANIHEQRPNNYYLHDLPNGGKFARQDKVPVSPGAAITIGSVGYIFGNGVIGWGFGGKVTGDKLWSRVFLQGHELYYKPGESTISDLSEFPYLTPSDREYYTCYTGVEDVLGMTYSALNRTWGRTHGGTKGFLKIRVNGGAWINPANADADDLVDGQLDQRIVGRYQMKGNELSYWLCDPYADNSTRLVEFEHPTQPGTVYSLSMATNVAKFGNVNF